MRRSFGDHAEGHAAVVVPEHEDECEPCMVRTRLIVQIVA